jgi:hypothetical protein
MTVGCHVGGAGVGRRGQERVGWAHWFLASVGQPASAWHGIRHAQAGLSGSRRRQQPTGCSHSGRRHACLLWRMPSDSVTLSDGHNPG